MLESSAGGVESTGTVPTPERNMEIAALAPVQNVPASGKSFVQLGAFSSEANAERLRKQYSNLSGLEIVKKPNASGQTLYHVRMGPYDTSEASLRALQQTKDAGADARIVRE